jgi:glycine cleavage system H lipoate-binding protein
MRKMQWLSSRCVRTMGILGDPVGPLRLPEPIAGGPDRSRPTSSGTGDRIGFPSLCQGVGPPGPQRGVRDRGPGGDPEPTGQAPGACPAGVPALLHSGLWTRQELDRVVTVGLAEEMIGKVGRVMRFRGPVPGTFHRRGEPLVSLESEKWVGHFPNPLDGTVLEVNEHWYREPWALNSCPWTEAWFYRLLPASSVGGRPPDPRPERGPGAP